MLDNDDDDGDGDVSVCEDDSVSNHAVSVVWLCVGHVDASCACVDFELVI